MAPRPTRDVEADHLTQLGTDLFNAIVEASADPDVLEVLIPTQSKQLDNMLRKLTMSPEICNVSKYFRNTEYCRQLLASAVQSAQKQMTSKSQKIALRGNIVTRCLKWREERAAKITKGNADLKFQSFADLTPPAKFEHDWQIIILMRDGVDIFSTSETDKRKLVALLRAQLYLHRYALPADRDNREYEPIADFSALGAALIGARKKDPFYARQYGLYPEAWDVSQCTDLGHLFNAFKVVNDGNPAPDNAFHIGAWDTSSVNDIRQLFMDSTLNVYIAQWNVRKLHSAPRMFKNCKTFDQPIDEWDLESLAVADDMFDNCNPEFARKAASHVGKYYVFHDLGVQVQAIT